MGNGGLIYESSKTQGYLRGITHNLERELAGRFTPDAVIENGLWLARVLAVIELHLLLEQHEFSSSGWLSYRQDIPRWRDVFLGVWDGDWRITDDSYNAYPYNDPDYRQQYPLPYFSILRRSKGKDQGVRVDRFIHDLIENLMRDIIILLSPEMRRKVLMFDAEEVWAAVDVLGLVCIVHRLRAVAGGGSAFHPRLARDD
jgi:hypothetical protein